MATKHQCAIKGTLVTADECASISLDADHVGFAKGRQGSDMIQPDSIYALRHKNNRHPRGCFPYRARHLKNKGEGTAKSYFDRPGSGLLGRDGINWAKARS